MLSSDPTYDIAVVFPLVEPRGDPFEKVRSWTATQTLPRERYQIIAVSNGSNPASDNAIAAMLAPHDRLVHCASGNLAELFNCGVDHAEAPLLLLTEHHCIADANCLHEVVAWFRQHDCAAAALQVKSICLTELARIDCRICDPDLPALLADDHWNLVSKRGFAIRRDVMLAVGGLEADHDAFAEVALGAQLHSLGYRVGYVERAIVDHIDDNTFSKSLALIRDYTQCEMTYYASHDLDFCQRYFGQMPEWQVREPAAAQITVRELWRALRSALRMPVGRNNISVLRTLSVELLRQGAGRLLTTRMPLGLVRALVTLAWLRFVCARWNEARRFRAYEQARRHMVHYVRLEYLSQHPISANGASHASPDCVPGNVDETRLLGFHVCESYQGESFWWTGPAALVRLDVEPHEFDIVIDTHSLRGAACDFPVAFFMNGCRVTREAIRANDGRLHLSVRRELLNAAGPQWLTIVCRPLRSRGERRRLGLPIFSLRLRSAAAQRRAA